MSHGNPQRYITKGGCFRRLALSIANLSKLLQEVESQAVLAQQQISVVKSQLSSKQREMRLIQLTDKEIGQLPKSTKVYEGVGKMYDDLS